MEPKCPPEELLCSGNSPPLDPQSCQRESSSCFLAVLEVLGFFLFFLSVLERCLGAQVNPRGSCVSVRGETSPRADGTEVPAHQNPLNKMFKV